MDVRVCFYELLPTEVVCQRGVYDSSVHLESKVPGAWLTTTGSRPARLLECMGIQNWCPTPVVPNADVDSVIGGQRFGGSLLITCTLGFMRYALFMCKLDRSWEAPSLGNLPLTQFSCAPITGYCPGPCGPL